MARAQQMPLLVFPGDQPADVLPMIRVDSAPETRAPGSIRGTVQDISGVTVAGAAVTLAVADAARIQHTTSDSEGQFSFADVEPGPYALTVVMPGLEPRSTSGVLRHGEELNLAEIVLPISPATAEVEVSASKAEVAAAQLKLEEKQRVLGFVPNFYASYIWDAAPLTRRQKFSLAWRFTTDPAAFVMTGAVAGTEQSQNAFGGYGGGAMGYGKRFGASYADGFSSTMLGQAIFPALFHQDPRYFVKGTGSIRSRAMYSVATTVMCRGDNGHWQVNYSNILGNLASASISNLYYPASSREGATLTVRNSLVTTAFGALGGLIQEFFLRRMTPNVPDYSSALRR